MELPRLMLVVIFVVDVMDGIAFDIESTTLVSAEEKKEEQEQLHVQQCEEIIIQQHNKNSSTVSIQRHQMHSES